MRRDGFTFISYFVAALQAAKKLLNEAQEGTEAGFVTVHTSRPYRIGRLYSRTKPRVCRQNNPVNGVLSLFLAKAKPSRNDADKITLPA